MRLYERFDRGREDIEYILTDLIKYSFSEGVMLCSNALIRSRMIEYPETTYYYNEELDLCLANIGDEVITVLRGHVPPDKN